jgi:hypothetical protein
VTVRLWSDDVRFLRQMGNGSLAEGIRRCILAANNQGITAAVNAAGDMAANNQVEPAAPVPTSAVSHRVPVAPRPERLPVRVPPASRLPKSLTAWDDD